MTDFRAFRSANYSIGPSHSVGPFSDPAAAGFSLQRSAGPFVDRSRGCENANRK